jgi:protein-disulfide isomerase
MRRSTVACCLYLILGNIIFCSILVAQESVIPTATLDEVLREVRRIREILEKRGQEAPRKLVIELEITNLLYLGGVDASLAVVAFTDYECIHCKSFHRRTFQDLRRLYVDTGQVRYYHAPMPIVEQSPSSVQAAVAANCVSQLDISRFWDFHSEMQLSEKPLSRDTIFDISDRKKIDRAALSRCMDDPTEFDKLSTQLLESRSAGVTGTPAFLVGKIIDSHVVGELIIGDVPLGILERAMSAQRAVSLEVVLPESKKIPSAAGENKNQ